MARFTDLPDELILQILRHNVSESIKSRLGLIAHIHNHIISRRFYSIAKDAFYHEFVHNLEIYLPYVEGMLLGRVNFIKRIRKVRIRSNKLWIHFIDVAMAKLVDIFRHYPNLREVEVIIGEYHSRKSFGAESKISEALSEWQKSRRRDVKITVRTENHDLLRKNQT